MDFTDSSDGQGGRLHKIMRNANIEIISHRGRAVGFVDNTLPAFENAMALGASGFECDVRFTKDREPIVVHTRFGSAYLSEQATARLRISEMSWEEIQACRSSGSNLSPCHLDDVLKFAASANAICYVEPKEDNVELIRRVIDGFERVGLNGNGRLITFFSRRRLLAQAKALNQSVLTNVIVVSPLADLSGAARAASADIVTLGWVRLNQFRCLQVFGRPLRRKICACQDHGFRVMTGYIDSVDDLRWACELGVDGIFTNDVATIAPGRLAAGGDGVERARARKARNWPDDLKRNGWI